MSNALSGSTVPPRALNSVIVVGGGLAALRTGQALRAHGFIGSITLISDEPRAPYDRPPLSKHLLTNDSVVDLAQDLSADLTEIFDEVHLSHRAVAVEEGEDSLIVKCIANPGSSAHAPLDQSCSCQFVAHALVLALGAQPVVPHSWDGARSLYTWEDAVHLKSAVLGHSQETDASVDAQLVIIGSGWVGTEVAGVARTKTSNVVVLESAQTPLERQVGPQVGGRIAQWFAAAGVTLLTQATVTEISSTPQGYSVSGVRGDDASTFTVTAREVLSAVGVRPRTDWLPSNFARTAVGALLTDQVGRVYTASNDPRPLERIFAVGDCAYREDAVHGHIPGGHWNIALTDPERVARALTSNVEETSQAIPTPTPYVFSTQFGHDISLFGLPNPAQDSVVFRDYDNETWTAFYCAQDPTLTQEVLVTGIFTCGTPRDAAAARKYLKNGPVPVRSLSALSDPGVPLKSALA